MTLSRRTQYLKAEGQVGYCCRQALRSPTELARRFSQGQSNAKLHNAQATREDVCVITVPREGRAINRSLQANTITSFRTTVALPEDFCVARTRLRFRQVRELKAEDWLGHRCECYLVR